MVVIALIGQIAISTIVEVKKLQDGLKAASSAINRFGAFARSTLGTMFEPLILGAKATASSIEYVTRPLRRVRAGLSAVQAAMARLASFAGARLSPIFAPIILGAKASASAIEYTTRPLRGLVRWVGDWGKALYTVVGQPAVQAVKRFGTRAHAAFTTFRVMHADKIALVGKYLGQVWSGLSKVGSFAFKAGAMLVRGIGVVAVKAFEGLTSAVSASGSGILHLGKTIAVLGVVGVVAGGAFLWNVISGAIALGEQADRARVIFGKFADHVISQAKLMGEAYGISRKSFIAAASAFGTIFQGVGYADEAAAQLSVHFTKLATDLSSLVHIPVAEAMEKIQSGLAGQVRPLREVGLFMSEDGIKAYAAAHGIAKLGKELTESQKVQARVGFITEGLAKAHGNLAATADSAANQIRSLQGRFENLKDTIGSALLGFLVPVLEDINTGLVIIQTSWDKTAFAAKNSSVGVLSGAEKQTQGIGFLQKTIMFVADGWQTVKIRAIEAVQSINSAISQLLTGLYPVARELDAAAKFANALFGKRVPAVLTEGIGDAKLAVQKLSIELEKLHAKEKAQPKASIAIAQSFEDARKSIQAARDALKGPGLDVNKLAPQGAAAGAAAAPKFAHAMEANSKEAANAILTARYGHNANPGKKPEEATARNTAETNRLLIGIAAQLGRAIGPSVGNALAGFGNF